MAQGRNEKLRNMKVTVILVIIRALKTALKCSKKRQEKIENSGKSCSYPNDGIVENNKESKEISVVTRRLFAT